MQEEASGAREHNAPGWVRPRRHVNSLEGWVGGSRAHGSAELRQQSLGSLESCGLREKLSKYVFGKCVVFTKWSWLRFSFVMDY